MPSIRFAAVPFAVAAPFAAAAVAGGAAAQGWAFVPSPPASGSNHLHAISGSAASDVWAVGSAPDGLGGSYSFAMHFDGMAWTAVPTPNRDPVSPNDLLSGVVTTSPTRALAVGSYTPVGSSTQTLALEWDGAAWIDVPSPIYTGGSAFSAAARTPEGEEWAAGHHFVQGHPPPPLLVAMLARRNAAGWTLVDAPPVGSHRNEFHGIAALSSAEIFAVGAKSEGPGDSDVLIQRYDGAGAWTTFAVPTPGAYDSLQAVAAISSTDVWAAGWWYPLSTGNTQPLLLHFDGTAWTQAALPPFPDGACELHGIAARSSTDVTAVGAYATAGGTPRPFVLHYDGVAWSPRSLPISGASEEWLRAAAATPDGDVWAVGQRLDGSVTAGLTLRSAGAPGVQGSVLPFGDGTPGCSGPHVLQGNSLPQVGHSGFAVVADSAPPGSSGFVVIGNVADVGGSDPYAFGVDLHVAIDQSTLLLSVSAPVSQLGVATAALPIPADPTLSGLTVYAQAVFAWGGACALGPSGLSSSNGLAITIQ